MEQSQTDDNIEIVNLVPRFINFYKNAKEVSSDANAIYKGILPYLEEKEKHIL